MRLAMRDNLKNINIAYMRVCMVLSICIDKNNKNIE